MDAKFTNLILTALTATQTTKSKKIYYDHVPEADLEILKRYCIVFKLSNTGNQDSFDAKEMSRGFQLTIQSCSTNLDLLAANTDIIKSAIYNLQFSGKVNYVSLDDDETFFDMS